MAIEGGTPQTTKPVPTKNNVHSSRRRGPATNPPSTATTNTTNPTAPNNNNAQEQHEPLPQQQQHHPNQNQHHQQQQHVRHRQNRVGKRYRDKLTAGFESLQAALGVEDGDGLDGAGTESREDGATTTNTARGGGGAGTGAGRRRRRPLNKARIIDLTCVRVRELLGEWDAVRAEVEGLRRERALLGW
ncbi:hypothetical protein B0I37DRAFT_435663 [Chaetomium sp. MPI-CAGE-AT-0009]|nr:hypothetical protein B0I37DRAFT_435663 [Chaetomium sp. MPI-CAGE-AT-0009]